MTDTIGIYADTEVASQDVIQHKGGFGYSPIGGILLSSQSFFRKQMAQETHQKIDLLAVRSAVGELARTTGKHIWGKRQAEALVVETKGRHDFVTQMDKLSERMLVEGLEKIVPEAGFIAEEKTRTDVSETINWIVDPIDGTTNFIHAMPPFAISIALMVEGHVVVGVVYEMSHDELFSASLGGGATLNGKAIHVSQVGMADALVATGFPYNEFSRMDAYMSSLRFFMEGTAGVRRLGSAATDMAYVAAGRYDAFYEYDLKPYDVAAGCLLVTEAGGKLADFRGGDDYIFGKEMVATNATAFEEFFGVVNRAFSSK